MRTLNLRLLLTFVFLALLLTSFSEAEVLHNWNESNPNHAFDSGHTVEDLFSTHTSKSASRSESNGSWSLTASASASANAQAPLPRGGDLSQQFDAHALVRATGDKDTLEPHSGDGLAKTADGAEIKKTSSDGTTTASTKRKAHVVLYQQRVGQQPLQRVLDASTSGSKSQTSSSPTGLDADPWAKSWLRVNRRTNLANDVDGSPFTSTTPDCTSSGNGHTCAGATPPPPPRQTVYCQRGNACQNKPGVQGNNKAHKIKCPERTYKQGAWAWLLIKLKEDCKGEKWSCHSDASNCTRKHLHLSNTSGGTIINGVFVPSGYSIGACGEHLYASGSASDHAQKTGDCGHTYYACLQGNHDQLQASCSTDTNCISTNFYLCNHNSHTYLSQQPCGHRYAPSSSAAYNHRSVDYSCDKHSYYACQPPSSSETNRHSYQTMPCGNHNYYACRMPSTHKRAITCPTDSNGQSCSHSSYYACSPHTHQYPAVQPAMRRCGQHTKAEGGNHSWVASCQETNASGDRCTRTSPYFACSPHNHQYPVAQPAMRQCGQHTKAESGNHSWDICSSCGNGYFACHSDKIARHVTVRTCRRPGCGVTFTRCSNGACTSNWGTRSSHWAQ